MFSLKYTLGLSGGTAALLVTGERIGRVTALPLCEWCHSPGVSAHTRALYSQAFHWVLVMIDA